VKTVGVLYATREGHTQRIAEHVAADLRLRGLHPEVENLGTRAAAINLRDYSGVILAASVHAGVHESEMVKFVKTNRTALEAMPAAFLSVTLSEAGAERADATPLEHAAFVADVEQVIGRFFEETGWRPQHVKPVAGALLYTRYNVLLRFLLKRIARKSGGSTDTSRDHVYTDWQALDQFVNEFAGEIARRDNQRSQ
jgi:menaquinone-dependent protoporphyrinogen oxidase